MKANDTALKIAAAARQVLNKEGAEAITMRRVASAVGFTPMALYRHFTDRADLLNAVADGGFDELAARLVKRRLGGSVEERLSDILDINVKYALHNPRLFELMFLTLREGARQYPQDFKAGRSPTAIHTAELVQEGIDSGYFRRDDAWEITFEMGALLQGLIVLYLGGRMSMSATQFRAFCHRSLRRYINGIRE